MHYELQTTNYQLLVYTLAKLCQSVNISSCHCEERNDEAISFIRFFYLNLPCLPDKIWLGGSLKRSLGMAPPWNKRRVFE
jgi:hypothetical protein